jgi:hypothetical protein
MQDVRTTQPLDLPDQEPTVQRRHILTALVAVLAAGAVAAGPANAAKPKGFTKTVTFADATPDPTGGAISSDVDPTLMICDGKLPREKSLAVKIPAPGKLKITIDGFQGDWALSFRDSKDKFIAGDDVNPDPSNPVFEAVSVKVKKAGTYNLLPCNLGGTNSASMKYVYTPS